MIRLNLIQYFILIVFILINGCASIPRKQYDLSEKNIFFCRLVTPQDTKETLAPLALLNIVFGKKRKPKAIVLAYLKISPVNQSTMDSIVKLLQETDTEPSYSRITQALFGFKSEQSSPNLTGNFFTTENHTFDCYKTSSEDEYIRITISDILKKEHSNNENKKYECRYTLNDDAKLNSMFFLMNEIKGSNNIKNSFQKSNCHMIDIYKVSKIGNSNPLTLDLPVYEVYSYNQDDETIENTSRLLDILSNNPEASYMPKITLRRKKRREELEICPNVTFLPKKEWKSLNGSEEESKSLKGSEEELKSLKGFEKELSKSDEKNNEVVCAKRSSVLDQGKIDEDRKVINPDGKEGGGDSQKKVGFFRNKGPLVLKIGLIFLVGIISCFLAILIFLSVKSLYKSSDAMLI